MNEHNWYLTVGIIWIAIWVTVIATETGKERSTKPIGLEGIVIILLLTGVPFVLGYLAGITQ